MKKALLLGNGMNRIGADYSWEKLIEDLMKHIDPTSPIESEGKPFPLLYEEMVQGAMGVGMDEGALKQHIAELVTRIPGNDLHQRLPSLAVSDILTTNYDYNIEAVWLGAKPKEEDTTESKYSFFRRKTFDGTNVWHIHGERDMPDSILLGYEHYAGYMQYMRDYALKGRDVRGARALVQRLKKGIDSVAHSWVDLLFNRRVYILGLTMDYVEMHLWWLFTWRARLQKLAESDIPNKITYIYPRFVSDQIRHRLQLLTVAGIELQRIEIREEGEWRRFYQYALRYVENDKIV